MNRTIADRVSARHTKSLIAVLTLVCGCDDSIPRHQTCGPSATLVNSAVSSFNAQIDQTGSITFRSWNGEWIGSDCDTELQFTPHGHVQMREYGFGHDSYAGLYHINDNGKIHLTFLDDLSPTFTGTFPELMLSSDAKSLLIRPEIKGNDYKKFNRGGETFTEYFWMYWPFRRVNAPHVQ